MNPNATREIQAALDDHLAAYAAIEVAWPGGFYRPAHPQPYLTPSTAALTRTPRGAGQDSPHLWSGVYEIRVNYPAGEGLDPVHTEVDALLAHFARGTTLALASGGRVVVQSSSPMPGVPTPDWVSVPVRVTWFYSEE